MKRALIVIAVVILALLGYLRLTSGDRGSADIQEIRTNPGGALAGKTMIVTLADGRVYPVNYLRENGLVFMGIDGLWWRDFEGDGAPVTMEIQGETITGHARVELDRPAYKEDIFSRLRPTVPEWLPDWLNGKLVVITPDVDQD